ncbi:MAG: putative zinc-binding protein [Acidobacteria bacterium]|nr:putative zinc-binding protein [Acidobacteriota bacterium]
MPDTHETVHIRKTQAGCGLCEDFAAREASKPIVVMACEGACLRGELARLAANHLCDEILPDRTARLCLGGAFTKDTGQRNLARRAERLVAIEGCPIACSTRMMEAVLPGLEPEVFQVPALVRFDARLFSIREMPEAERKAKAVEAAELVAGAL